MCNDIVMVCNDIVMVCNDIMCNDILMMCNDIVMMCFRWFDKSITSCISGDSLYSGSNLEHSLLDAMVKQTIIIALLCNIK